MNFLNGNHVSVWIAQGGIWPLVIMLIPTLMFRRYGQASLKKRKASLIHAVAVFAVTLVAGFIAEKDLKDLYLWIAIVVVITVLFVFRKNVFPYSLKCDECGKLLDFRTIYFMGDNACSSCHERLMAETAEETGGGNLESTDVTDTADETVDDED